MSVAVPYVEQCHGMVEYVQIERVASLRHDEHCLRQVNYFTDDKEQHDSTRPPAIVEVATPTDGGCPSLGEEDPHGREEGGEEDQLQDTDQVVPPREEAVPDDGHTVRVELDQEDVDDGQGPDEGGLGRGPFGGGARGLKNEKG